MIAAVLLALGAASAFALHATADRTASPAAIAAAVGIAAALAILVVLGVPRVESARESGIGTLLMGALAGVTAVAAPYLVSTYRYSDAPSGSLVVFFTTTMWGLLAVLAAAVLSAGRAEDSRSRRAALVPISGGLLAAVAGAGILANWERPSSFNLIVRFGSEQAVMLGAGVLWVAGLVTVAVLVRRARPNVVGAAYAVGAIVAALAMLPFARMAEADIPVLLPYAAIAGLTTALALWLSLQQRVDIVGPPLFAAPVLLSALTIVEQMTGMLGPRPLQVTSVMLASVLVVLGIAASLERRRAAAPSGSPAVASGALAAVGRVAAFAATAVALVAMVVPALAVEVHGMLPSQDAFDLQFTMRGFESLGPWLSLSAALLVLAAWFGADRLSSLLRAVAAIGAGAAAVAPLGGTPLHTWVTWVPPEVQQDYGTEYAYIVFERLPALWLWGAGFVALVSILLLARLLLLPSRTQEHRNGAATEARR